MRSLDARKLSDQGKSRNPAPTPGNNNTNPGPFFDASHEHLDIVEDYFDTKDDEQGELEIGQNEEDVCLVARGGATTDVGSGRRAWGSGLRSRVERVWKGRQHQARGPRVLQAPFRRRRTESDPAKAASHLPGLDSRAADGKVWDNAADEAASVTFDNEAAVVSIGHDGQDPYLQVNTRRTDDDYDDIARYPFVRGI